MSCNSCSNVTLPGVVGPAGSPGPNGTNGNGIVSTSWTSNSGGDPQGTQGTTDTYTITYDDATTSTFLVTNGANGTNGINGTSIIEIDTVLGGGTTSQTSSTTPQKSFDIPANTWQNDGDMVELEIMAVGESFDIGYHRIYITIGSAPVPIDIDALFSTWLANGYVGSESRIEPLMHLKLQLSMGITGTLTPVTDFRSDAGIYSIESTNPFSNARYVSKHRGAQLTGVPVSGIVPIDVYMVSVDGTVSVKLFYFKLTSYKA